MQPEVLGTRPKACIFVGTSGYYFPSMCDDTYMICGHHYNNESFNISCIADSDMGWGAGVLSSDLDLWGIEGLS